ncbi:TPA: hypothetical protein NJ338_004563 [Vibrio parahaemolyticus]|nr:hypothetical protein [Vibrio parahaemolyticus]MBM4851124.1 hypothetical protein [Vibrio parahaemolyticus]HBC3436651.1 hypothetical protein [Vibrio parahaemolyticus]HBH7866991.1 hypothetical protein [Vibrio parahaemolyticus]HCE3084509.1 hypothetical protein [Vibrio parahaemolyticus]
MADFFSYNLKTNKMEIMPHGESTIYEFEIPLKFCLESINDPNSALSKILNTTSKKIFEAKDLIYMTLEEKDSFFEWETAEVQLSKKQASDESNEIFFAFIFDFLKVDFALQSSQIISIYQNALSSLGYKFEFLLDAGKYTLYVDVALPQAEDNLRDYILDLYVKMGFVREQVFKDLNNFINSEKIEKVIEFPAEYFDAGLGVLSYFGTYLRKKYPEEKASVSIEQDGITVIMSIKSHNGDVEVIKRALNEYELVMSGRIQPELTSSDANLVRELEREKVYALERYKSTKLRIEDLEKDKKELREDKRVLQASLDKAIELALSRNQNTIIEVSPEFVNKNDNRVKNTVNIEINQHIASTIGTLSQLMADLSLNEADATALSRLKDDLSSIQKETNPENVINSPAMSRFSSFLEQVNDAGSGINKAIEQLSDGWGVASKLAEKYNQIASWCGLPQVPKLFMK